MRRIAVASIVLLVLLVGCTATGTQPLPTSFPPATDLPAAPSATVPSATASLVSPASSPAATTAATAAAGCPSSPMRVDELLDGADCFGGADVVVIGWLAPAWGIGGVESGIEPAWLGEMPGDPVLWQRPRNPNGCFDDDDCVWTFVHRAPGGLVLGGPERWVALTGHFLDPAAETCTWGGALGVPMTNDEAVDRCRTAFVGTAVEDTAAP